MQKMPRAFFKTGYIALVASAMLFLSTGAQADRLKEIKARGSLICATLTNVEPLAYQDPATRKYVGFDIDVCTSIAKRLGVSMEHKPVALEARVPELRLGRVDLVSAALGYTKERAEQIAFTSSHYQVPMKVIVLSNSGLAALDDLRGKKISATKGSTAELEARRLIPSADMLTFQDSSTAFLALKQGKVQGQAVSEFTGLRFLSEGEGKFRFLKDNLSYEIEALGVRKDEPQLLAAVNKALQEMESAGEIEAAWVKWYGPGTKFNLVREKKLTPYAEYSGL